MVNTRNNQCND
jgi:hypothetical protein